MAIIRRPVSRKKKLVPVPTATPTQTPTKRRTIKEGPAPRGSAIRPHTGKLGALPSRRRTKIEQQEMEELYHNYGADYRRWLDTGRPSGVFGRRGAARKE